MRAWILVLMSLFVLGATTVELLQTALAPGHDACASDGDDDEDHCPPFSDDCHDCAQCIHNNALPPVLASLLPPRPPVCSGNLPEVGVGRAPPGAPASEILTVPRA